MIVNVMGGEVRLELPIGAIEDIARVNPRLEALYRGIIKGDWTLAEVRAVIDAAARHSDVPQVSFDGVAAYEGLGAAKVLAAALFEEQWMSLENRKKLPPLDLSGAMEGESASASMSG